MDKLPNLIFTGTHEQEFALALRIQEIRSCTDIAELKKKANLSINITFTLQSTLVDIIKDETAELPLHKQFSLKMQMDAINDCNDIATLQDYIIGSLRHNLILAINLDQMQE